MDVMRGPHYRESTPNAAIVPFSNQQSSFDNHQSALATERRRTDTLGDESSVACLGDEIFESVADSFA